MPPRTKEMFFQFLDAGITVQAFENFLYSSPHLEKELGAAIYLELISFGYKDLKALEKATDFILDIVIDEGEFETWALLKVLNALIRNPMNLPEYLDWIYDKYSYNDYVRKGRFVEQGYLFLAHLAENVMSYMEEYHLKGVFGKNWKIALEKYKEDLPHYHQQLVPYTRAIIEALEKREIIIHRFFDYTISDKAKQELEDAEAFQITYKDIDWEESLSID